MHRMLTMDRLRTLLATRDRRRRRLLGNSALLLQADVVVVAAGNVELHTDCQKRMGLKCMTWPFEGKVVESQAPPPRFLVPFPDHANTCSQNGTRPIQAVSTHLLTHMRAYMSLKVFAVSLSLSLSATSETLPRKPGSLRLRTSATCHQKVQVEQSYLAQ